jgi:spore coat protein U-like protein
MKTFSSSRTHSLRMVAICAALVGLVPVAHAATASGAMSVSASVTGSCVVGASTLAFPSVTSAVISAGNVDAVGNISVNCTAGSAYTVLLNTGSSAGSTLANRKMSAGNNQWLGYSIYTTAARTTVWGDGTSGSGTMVGVGTGLSQSIFAYGRIFQGQIATAANYADVVNVTVQY